jgi:hypothetical protein
MYLWVNYKQKIRIFFYQILKVIKEISRIQIRTKMSGIPNTGLYYST